MTFIVALKVCLDDSRPMPFIVLIFLVSMGMGHAVNAASWENFVELSLKKSPQVQRVRYQYAVTNLNYLLSVQSLDWNATIESGALRDRTENSVRITTQTLSLEEKQINSISLSKSFLTGTDISLASTTEAIKTRSPAFADPQKFQSNSYLLTLEQNLWQNAFGFGIRNQLGAAKKESEIQELEKKESLEAVILEGAQLFWKVATLERRYKESEDILKRYEVLVKSVDKKNKNRYAAPGEFAQVKAQFFARQQQARLNEINYRKALLELKLYLPELVDSDLKWSLNSPHFRSHFETENRELLQTRSHRLTELRLEKSNLNSKSVESLNLSQLALVGQLGATGVDSSASQAEKEWLQGRRPSLYVGLKWSHTFGSGARQAQVKAARALALAQNLATDLEKKKLESQVQLLSEEIFSLEDNLKSQESQLQALRQAVQELSRNYNQGRIDINVLIDLINQAETAEVSHVEARANLELKFLEWKFLFDRIAVD